MNRRRVLAGLIAAPLILRPAAASLLARGGSGTNAAPIVGADVTATALAGLANNTWSSDLVVAGFHVDDLATCGLCTGGGTALGGGNMWSFSSGCYLPTQKKYGMHGTGGHSDSPNNGIFRLDLTTGKWATSENSGLYRTDGVAYAPNPCTNTETADKVQANAAGRYGPMAGHTYASEVYLPSSNLVFSAGQFSSPTATGNTGYILADGVTGQWRDDYAFSTLVNGSEAWMSFIPGTTDKLFASVGDDQINLHRIDPIAGTITNTHRQDVNNAYMEVNDLGCFGTIIPDPNNAGDFAAVCWADQVAGLATDKICYAPKVGSGATGQLTTLISFGGSVPAALQGAGSSDTHGSCWFDWAGNYKTGSTKILVWDWNGGTGLYLLDYATWTWTGPLSGSACPFGGVTQGWKLVFVLSDYTSIGSYLAIGLLHANGGGSSQGAFFVYRIPWSSL